MKRKNFRLTILKESYAARDEWERISWDEALDLVGRGHQKDVRPVRSDGILLWRVPATPRRYYDQNVCLLNALGGSHVEAGTVSFGSWSVVDSYDRWLRHVQHASPQLITSDLHVLFGCNWAATAPAITR